MGNTNKSACCGAEMYRYDYPVDYCADCGKQCNNRELAPTLPNREQILEFVKKQIEKNKWTSRYSLLMGSNRSLESLIKELHNRLIEIEQFIEGKE